MAWDIAALRSQFPILSTTVEGHPLRYLDAAATAQKPRTVLDAMRAFHETENANVHRGVHPLAERATERYESARDAVRGFLNAARREEIIFTKSCTESINLVARSWGERCEAGDVIALTRLEHHSNVIPWMQLAERKGLRLAWIDVEDDGRVRMEELDRVLASGKVRMVAVTGQGNVIGIRPDLAAVIEHAHAAGAMVCVDAAQMAAHHAIDVQALGCDFLAFSGHKLYGPGGIGVLYARKEILETMPPFLGGGSMIREVTDDGFTAAELPLMFEAGSPPVAEAVGLHAAIGWLSGLGWADLEAHETRLLAAALETLPSVEGLRVLGLADPAAISGCVSFMVEDVHPHDVTEILGRQGLCLRAGHHCAQPLHRRLGIVASTRLSVCAHTTEDEVRAVAPAVAEARRFLLGR